MFIYRQQILLDLVPSWATTGQQSQMLSKGRTGRMHCFSYLASTFYRTLCGIGGAFQTLKPDFKLLSEDFISSQHLLPLAGATRP